jgi:hypothetical protein
VRLVRVTRGSVVIGFDLGRDVGECRPTGLRVAVTLTLSGLPPHVESYPVSSPTGSLRVKLTRPPGTRKYGPADVLTVTATTAAGASSEAARIGLRPPAGERPLSNAQVRRIKAQREACRADINDRTTCRFGGLHPVSGPVTRATLPDLARSVRRGLTAYGGLSILRVNCSDGARCDAVIRISRHRLEMSYRIEALKHAPTCWELTGFTVTRPVPDAGGLAAPLPHQGCVDR